MEYAQDLIARFSKKQRHVWCLCPRCGLDRMKKGASKNALSRRADIYVCDVCGSVEAIEDEPHIGRGGKIPLEYWALAEHPEKFFLKGKDFNAFYFVFTDDESYPFQNSYAIVEGFDEIDAAHKVVGKYGKSDDGKLPYACYFTRDEWDQDQEMRKRYKYAGTLHLNGVFEIAE